MPSPLPHQKMTPTLRPRKYRPVWRGRHVDNSTHTTTAVSTEYTDASNGFPSSTASWVPLAYGLLYCVLGSFCPEAKTASRSDRRQAAVDSIENMLHNGDNRDLGDCKKHGKRKRQTEETVPHAMLINK